jgi:hypothetical protein
MKINRPWLSKSDTAMEFKFTQVVLLNTLVSGTLMKDMEMVDKCSKMDQNIRVTSSMEFSRDTGVTHGPNRHLREAQLQSNTVVTGIRETGLMAKWMERVNSITERVTCSNLTSEETSSSSKSPEVPSTHFCVKMRSVTSWEGLLTIQMESRQLLSTKLKRSTYTE